MPARRERAAACGADGPDRWAASVTPTATSSSTVATSKTYRLSAWSEPSNDTRYGLTAAIPAATRPTDAVATRRPRRPTTATVAAPMTAPTMRRPIGDVTP